MDLAIRTYAYLVVTATNLKDRLTDEDRGQTAVEYILVLALVALIVLALTQSTIVSQAGTRITQAVTELFTAAN